MWAFGQILIVQHFNGVPDGCIQIPIIYWHIGQEEGAVVGKKLVDFGGEECQQHEGEGSFHE